MSDPTLHAAARRRRTQAFAFACAALVLAGFPAARTAGAASVAPAGASLQLAPTGLRFDLCCYTTSMAVADLDGNGQSDVITGNGMSYDVSVLLASGTGGYLDPVSYPVDAFTLGFLAVAVGDVDGDGRIDVVATGFNNDEILLWPGDGNGGLGAATSLSAGSGHDPTAIAIADVDGDGKPDLVTANGDSNDVSVLKGDGAGGFAAPTHAPAGGWPLALAVADLDGDGHPDLVTLNSDSLDVSVLHGDGAGGFAPPSATSIGPDARPFGLAVGDLDGDGRPDVAVANAGSDGSMFPPPELPGSVSVLMNDGSGVLAAAVQYPVGSGDGRADHVVIGDVTGDGLADIVASRPLANAATVFAGDGAGGFGRAVLVPAGVGPAPLALADATGDGHVDVLTANAVGSSLSVLPGDGQGRVGFPGNFPAGNGPYAVAAGDLDGDGLPDVVTANAFADTVSVLLNDGAGGLRPPVDYPVESFPNSVAIGDMNGDGHADLVVANLGGGTVSVLRGDGAGGFGAATSTSVGGTFESPYALALGDANGDGKLDVATANTNISNDSISLLLGDGQGGFAPAQLFAPGPSGYYQPQGVVLADVTGDGHADIVTADTGADSLSLLVGDGAGGFAPALLLPTDLGPVAVAAGDVTGDGIVDLVSLDTTTQDVSVLVGDGAGGFAEPANYPIYPFEDVVDYNPWPWGLALADVDGDGMPDIVTANTQNDSVSVLPNDGAGGFGHFLNFGTGAHPGAAAVADIDGDGRADVITANRENADVSVLFNRTGSAADRIFADGFD